MLECMDAGDRKTMRKEEYDPGGVAGSFDVSHFYRHANPPG